MNITGSPLKGLLRELDLTPDDLVVVHDDLDLEPGRLRIRHNGGSGGHNGIKSVIEALGTPQFVRLKVGVGRPAPRQDSADYVLERVRLTKWPSIIRASNERSMRLNCCSTAISPPR